MEMQFYFLGAGALVGATLDGETVPLGNELRDILCDKFLEGNYKNESLQYVSDLCISDTGSIAVQRFIAKLFSGLAIADFHSKIPEFIWRAIFTTNYDRLIEIAYEKNANRLQQLSKIYSSEDTLDEFTQTNDSVPLLKLHGCVTNTNSEQLPLILTVDQYNDSLKGKRKGLFKYLYEQALSQPIIFVGHSLQDANIRAVLMDVHSEAPNHQRHYLLKPGAQPVEKNFYSEKKISTLDYTFEAFINELDSRISGVTRSLKLITPPKRLAVESRFLTRIRGSVDLARFLTDSCEFVSNSCTYDGGSPQLFYQGVDLGWYAVSENLAIERTISERIQNVAVESAENERTSNVELHVLKGEAGSGKTVVLRQLAWKLRNSSVGIFLWVINGAKIDINAVKELNEKTGERVFLLWDNAADNSIKIAEFYRQALKFSAKVSVITAERYNEWNSKCNDLDEIAEEVYELRYLGKAEIEQLVRKLEEHKCLGPNLETKTFDQRVEAFETHFGRQLLVALYEVTKGESFEDIIFDEYSEILPRTAQQIYLTVCTLNRIRVPVRAGLISRIHGINFKDFEARFLSPLEKIVLVGGRERFDYHYTARHSEIAEIVFQRALTNPTDRYNEYIRILKKLNPSYESDRASFRALVRARSLRDLFQSHEDIRSIYQTAMESIAEDHYLLQQMAIYEMSRENGNLIDAHTMLNKAIEIAPFDRSLVHSLYSNWRERANRTDDLEEKTKYRREAKAQLNRSVVKWGSNELTAYSLTQLALDDLIDSLNSEATSERVIDECIRSVESHLIELSRAHPSTGNAALLEAKFASAINDSDRARSALERSFQDNNRDPYIASRLSNLYMCAGNTGKAKNVLLQAIERNANNQKLQFRYAEFLRTTSSSNIDLLVYHYKRSYTPGDRNYQAQFWYARFLYESERAVDRDRALDIFRKLRRVNVSHQEKIKIRDFIGGKERPTLFRGELASKKPGYAFIKLDGDGSAIFFHPANAEDDLWEAMKNGDRLAFNIAFSFSGVSACSVGPE